MKKTVLAFTPISAPMIQRLEEDFHVISTLQEKGDPDKHFLEAVAHAHGLIGVDRKLDSNVLKSAGNLEVVSSISVGYDNYDLAYLNEHGVMLTNTPDVLTETTADLGFALIMSCARRVAELDRWTKAGNWKAAVTAKDFGNDVHGKTLGIVGMGNIGAAVARRGRLGFGMDIVYCANSPKPDVEQSLGATRRSLEQLLAMSDFVCVVVPLNEKTRKLLSYEQFALMKPSAYFINISRGPVIDEPALVQALEAGRIRGAGLDVYHKEPLEHSPLFAMPNVVTLPHVGAATTECRTAMGDRAVDNLRAALMGERPPDLVNPQVWKG